MGDEQYVDRDYMVYVTVKVYWPEIVSEENWSTLKDDNGYYPGVRLAVAFAEEHERQQESGVDSCRRFSLVPT